MKPSILAPSPYLFVWLATGAIAACSAGEGSSSTTTQSTTTTTQAQDSGGTDTHATTVTTPADSGTTSTTTTTTTVTTTPTDAATPTDTATASDTATGTDSSTATDATTATDTGTPPADTATTDTATTADTKPDTTTTTDSATTDTATTADTKPDTTTTTDSATTTDTGVADTGTPDTGVADTGIKDTGVADTGSDSGASSTCHPKFASGVNVAWFNFASDIPGPNIANFTSLFTNVKAVGGSAVRWWLHTDGMTTPGYNSSGMSNTISAQNITDLKNILDAAHAQNQGVVISLWSFGMLDSAQASNTTVLANNKLLLTNATNRQAYITNWLTPMVTALKGYPGLFGYEIFNEPEGMSSDHGGWVTNCSSACVASSYLQATANQFTAAIHAADPSALVTVGANNFGTLNGNGTNLWSNSALTGAGGQSTGTLDFYEVHYYNTWNGASADSPFAYPASHWNLDKNIVVGEFWAIDSPGANGADVAAANLYTTLYTNGYAGGWAWQYANVDGSCSGLLYPDGAAWTPCPATKWPVMQQPMQNLLNADPSALSCP